MLVLKLWNEPTPWRWYDPHLCYCGLLIYLIRGGLFEGNVFSLLLGLVSIISIKWELICALAVISEFFFKNSKDLKATAKVYTHRKEKEI